MWWKIFTTYWDKDRKPITRGTLAHRVARRLKDYLDSMNVSWCRSEIALGRCLILNRRISTWTPPLKNNGKSEKGSCTLTTCTWRALIPLPEVHTSLRSGLSIALCKLNEESRYEHRCITLWAQIRIESFLGYPPNCHDAQTNAMFRRFPRWPHVL